MPFFHVFRSNQRKVCFIFKLYLLKYVFFCAWQLQENISRTWRMGRHWLDQIRRYWHWSSILNSKTWGHSIVPELTLALVCFPWCYCFRYQTAARHLPPDSWRSMASFHHTASEISAELPVSVTVPAAKGPWKLARGARQAFIHSSSGDFRASSLPTCTHCTPVRPTDTDTRCRLLTCLLNVYHSLLFKTNNSRSYKFCPVFSVGKFLGTYSGHFEH